MATTKASLIANQPLRLWDQPAIEVTPALATAILSGMFDRDRDCSQGIGVKGLEQRDRSPLVVTNRMGASQDFAGQWV